MALGIAISPIPIIAAILMLLSPRAKANSTAFLIGWLVGIVVALLVFSTLASVIPQSGPDQPQPIAGVIKILIGALMLLLAGKEWRGRPHGDAEAELPKWMSAIDSMTAAKSLGLGFLLSTVNPKNLLLAAAAGTLVGSTGIPTGDIAIVVAIYTVIAGCSVLIPVIGYLIASNAMAKPLDSLRGWLVQHNAVVMAVLLLVIGVTVIGKGIGSF